MSKNDFKAFSTSNNANVVSQERYEESRDLLSGFPPNDVPTHLLNKVLRQSSTIASVVANFIAAQSGDDVLDDGDIAKLTAQLNRALEQKITAKIPSASLTQKGIVQLTNEMGNNDTLAVTQKLVQEIINSLRENINAKVPNSRKINGKALTGDINLTAGDVGAVLANDAMYSMNIDRLDGRENLYNGCAGFKPNAPFLTRYGLPSDRFGVQLRFSNINGPSSEGIDQVWSHRLIFVHGSDTYRTDHINLDYKITRKFWDDINAKPDANGNLKVASPVIEIYPDGTFSTNDESEGAEVIKQGTGIYRISNILGYNADGGWGVNGGISVPRDNNNLELIFVDDQVQSDGSIIIETFHRQHTHLPERFQNWRLKSIDDSGNKIFYQDGEPCDIPDSCRLDIRVQMPEDSLWNLNRKRLQEEMESTSASANK
ncbi:phage tail protein [Photorhabdus laumondii subsp. laumondii]|uniref:Photorhabdus luminescens subsp. laumondii TTO1 complete genome segment 7/17 n=2 Tax=Photorhabdus laumondii subsp. laumondii TaxID=141679 RepID=Q7N5B8_PHOLL|nr:MULTISPECIES: tail fiber protein [Photorhabdus]AXG47152.1 phage tail protein [Photorhabdus laumondii subsp. laumondii]KTL60169.1 phage tail protein [Photorhabdus laumondii subsp. laumondii]MCC8384227.1 tail fiber protein [Photorhabdus laumondii]MCC8413788.1 tail fiber protein [Photorhabdus laumondii]NDK94336.1 phage tail protein [Photorhabdus laumondii subsp. laumondii]